MELDNDDLYNAAREGAGAENYQISLEGYGVRAPKTRFRAPPATWNAEDEMQQATPREILSSALGRAFVRKFDPSASTKAGTALLERLDRFLSDSAACSIVGMQLLYDELSEDNTCEEEAEGRDVPDRDALVKAAAKKKEALVESLKGACKDLKNSGADFERFLRLRWYSSMALKLEDFVVFRAVGRGAFGMVSAAVVAELGEMVAIKEQDRRAVKSRRLVDTVLGEEAALKLLAKHPSPFCMRLLYSCSNEEKFYVVMPLAIGGDLKFHLQTGGFFSKKRSRMYAAEVALGLSHMHSLRVIYRDVKPENILLNSAGHCMISDLGLAKILPEGNETCTGRAGTPAYMAPEVKNSKGKKGAGYTYTVDWWSFGVMLYEFLLGVRPKLTDDDEEINFPKHYPQRKLDDDKIKFEKAAKKIITALLQRKATKRLGSTKKDGMRGIMTHSYFKKTKWAKVQRQKIKPEWVPKKGTVYAEHQQDIASKSKDAKYAEVKLEEEDLIEMSYVDRQSHEESIWEVVLMEDENSPVLDKLPTHTSGSATGGCRVS